MARQRTGTAGKVTDCQIGVSLSLVTDTESCPVDWRLFLPESWDPASPAATAGVDQRCARAQIPDDVGHREKWRLGLDMIDEVIGWGLRAPLIVADAGYGDEAKGPRAGLTLYAVLRDLQALLARLIGTCLTCKTRFPARRRPPIPTPIMTKHY